MYTGYTESQEKVDARLARINEIGDVQKMAAITAERNSKPPTEAEIAQAIEDLNEALERFKAKHKIEKPAPAPKGSNVLKEIAYAWLAWAIISLLFGLLMTSL